MLRLRSPVSTEGGDAPGWQGATTENTGRHSCPNWLFEIGNLDSISLVHQLGRPCARRCHVINLAETAVASPAHVDGPDNRGSGLPSSERGARPLRIARPVAGLRSRLSV
jgi:hypothetical protein